MKTSLVFLTVLAALAATGSVQAQDTIDGHDEMGNYLYCGCPINIDKYDFVITPYGGFRPNGGELAKYNHSDSDLTVYGLAVGLIESFPELSVYDTSYDNCFEYLRLYLPQADSLQWVRQTKVHLHHTPVTYYADYSSGSINGMYTMVPMYERYFDTAVTVSGTFYTGMTFTAKQPFFDSVNSIPYNLERREPYLLSIRTFDMSNPYNEEVNCMDTIFSMSYTSNLWTKRLDEHFILYPILTPNPDTTANGDTLAVGEPDMLQRLTGVMPNPAASTAKVVSSFGLTRIEVYSSTGARVYDRPAVGLAATLDVSRWPSGTYMVRIHTPMGVATKRLAVAR